MIEFILFLLFLAGLYWTGLYLNPPQEEGHPIVPEPHNMLRGEEE